MPSTPQTVLVPFTAGLDTFSNPQLLQPGTLTKSMGTMLDRAGTAYPGPGFTPAQWTPSGVIWTNHGIANLNNGPNTNIDQLAFWATQSGGNGPGISPAGSASVTPAQQRLAPWRQVTQRILSDTQKAATVASTMSGPPQVAVCGNLAMIAWLMTPGYVQMVIQDLTTRALQGPYTLQTNYNWTTGAAALTVDKFALAGDGTYFRIVTLIGSTVYPCGAYITSAPTVSVSGTSPGLLPASGNYNNIDAIGTGDETASGSGVFIAFDSDNHNLVGFPFSYTSSGVTQTPTAIITGASTTLTAAPITVNPIRTQDGLSTGFVFATVKSPGASGNPLIATSTLALGSIVQTTITGVTTANPRALTITNTASGSAAVVSLAVELGAAGGLNGGPSGKWNSISLKQITIASPGTVPPVVTVTGYGGAAILGKFYPWSSGAEFRPLFPARTGWWNLTGAWGTRTTAGTGTFAYPNGYLFDHLGSLYAKFGDADVGTDSIWPDFASYTANLLQPVPSGFHYTFASGQRSLVYAWPQLGHFDFISARASDAGSPIGARAGVSTVSWLAPTASEPPAQAVQFGSELVIPGTITAVFDGSNVFESGFFHRAPQPLAVSNGGGGTLPNATTYYYQIVMVYQDLTGRVHYSAPSLRVSVVTTAASDLINIHAQYGAPTSLTLKDPGQISFQLFRSAGNPTGNAIAMYLVGSNVTTDTLADSDLTQNPTIYTYGQAAGASIGTAAPPPFDSLTVWNNQVWGVANRNGPELWCTWPLDSAAIAPEGPAWSAENIVPIPAEVGQPKALRGLDEKLILLGTRADYGLIGSAPDRSVSLADNPSFSAPLLIPTPGGIRALNGAVRIPEGLLFQGSHGFMLLGRDLSYKPVGRPVSLFTQSNLYLPGIFLPEQQAVLFFSATDVTQNLMYFYGTEQWAQVEQPPADSTNTAAAAVITGAVRTTAGVTPKVYVFPSTGSYYASVDLYSKYLAYRTPWVELTDHTPTKGVAQGIAGYGMLREVQVLGTLPAGLQGGQTLTLYTEYDYENNTAQLPESQALSLTAGSQAALAYQWRFGFAQGQAARVRFTVTVDGGVRSSNGSTAPTILLSGLMLSYDVDVGLTRLGSSNSKGT